MRILHLDSGSQMRGGQWQAMLLLEGLRERGCESLLLARRGSKLFELAAKRRIPVKELSWANIFRLWRSFDLIHAHDSRSHTLAAVRPAALPLVVSRRVAFPSGSGPLSRWKYGRASHYIAISNAVAGSLRQAEVPERKISVVYDGVRVPERTCFSPSGHIVAIKTDDPLKGGDLLREAERLGGVRIHYSANLASDLVSAGLFVYITQQEGLGSAALVAMAAGIPVVASAVGGLPEIVHPGVTGLLTPNQPASIASAIRRMVDDPALASSLAANARALVESRFTVDHMVNGTLSVYREVIGC